MAKTSRTKAKAADAAPRVAIVGAGIAGLTAALRLSRAGFAVTLYEATAELGGNISSQRVNDVCHDVYPHMFCQWYDNFWDVFENDLGIARDKAFEPRAGVKLLHKGSNEYIDLYNASSLDAALANLKSGLLSPPEMFLLGFSMLDLVAHPFNRLGLDQLDMLDVNGFIYSRGYATEPVAKLQNYILMLIWSIKSSQTAAASYQDFIKHTFSYPDGAPFAWMLKGSLAEKVVAPMAEKLKDLGCVVAVNTPVDAIRIVDGHPAIHVRGESKSYDHVILAVSPEALVKLAMGGKEDLPGTRIVAKLPDLSQLQQLYRMPIPVVDLYLNITLPNFPAEHIGLAGSRYDLTVLDFSQLWTDQTFNGTALVIAASDAAGLPSSDPNEQGHMIIAELAACIPQFRPGAFWGDPDSDVDWTRTHFRNNVDYPLFINDIGSWEWRPQASYPDVLPRVHFAGDFCKTDVDMATIEAATQSGILAARGVQAQDAASNGGTLRGDAIAMKGHTLYSTTSFRAAKLALLPLAYGAVVWAAYEQQKRLEENGALPLGNAQYSLAEYLVVLPMQFALDWYKSAYWLARSLSVDPKTAGVRSDILHGDSFEGDVPTNPGSLSAVDDDDKVIGLAEATLLVVGDLLDNLARRLPGREDPPKAGAKAAAPPPGSAKAAPPPIADSLGALLAGATRFASDTATAFADSWAAGKAGSSGATPPDGYKRRARIKP